MTTKEVAALCGVTSRTVSGNARKAGVILEDGKRLRDNMKIKMSEANKKH